jgi:hypothetical protein
MPSFSLSHSGAFRRSGFSVEEDVDMGTDWIGDPAANLFRVDTHLEQRAAAAETWNSTASRELSSVVALAYFSECRWVGFYHTSKWR